MCLLGVSVCDVGLLLLDLNVLIWFSLCAVVFAFGCYLLLYLRFLVAFRFTLTLCLLAFGCCLPFRLSFWVL